MRGLSRCMALAAVLTQAALGAFDWPVDSPHVRTSFGTIGDGRFEPGIQIAAEGASVASIDAGEIIFVNGSGAPYPSGLGAWVAVAHEGGLVSIYGRLDPSSLPTASGKVAAGDSLGMTGLSGAASVAGLELMVFDSVKSAWVNPSIFLSPAPDKQRPTIQGSWIRRERDLLPLGPGARIRQGLCEIIADFHDSSSGKERIAPFSARVLISGVERIALTWDILAVRDGRALLFGEEGMSVRDFEVEQGRYRLGGFSLPRGRIGLDIIVSDYARNSRTQSYQVTVE